jgi:hypothetical protein
MGTAYNIEELDEHIKILRRSERFQFKSTDDILGELRTSSEFSGMNMEEIIDFLKSNNEIRRGKRGRVLSPITNTFEKRAEPILGTILRKLFNDNQISKHECRQKTVIGMILLFLYNIIAKNGWTVDEILKSNNKYLDRFDQELKYDSIEDIIKKTPEKKNNIYWSKKHKLVHNENYTQKTKTKTNSGTRHLIDEIKRLTKKK